jgi:hypothetical protein
VWYISTKPVGKKSITEKEKRGEKIKMEIYSDMPEALFLLHEQIILLQCKPF